MTDAEVVRQSGFEQRRDVPDPFERQLGVDIMQYDDFCLGMLQEYGSAEQDTARQVRSQFRHRSQEGVDGLLTAYDAYRATFIQRVAYGMSLGNNIMQQRLMSDGRYAATWQTVYAFARNMISSEAVQTYVAQQNPTAPEVVQQAMHRGVDFLVWNQALLDMQTYGYVGADTIRHASTETSANVMLAALDMRAVDRVWQAATRPTIWSVAVDQLYVRYPRNGLVRTARLIDEGVAAYGLARTTNQHTAHRQVQYPVPTPPPFQGRIPGEGHR